MILITRPEVESVLLAKELSKYNIETCIEPLISFSHYKNISFENRTTNYIVSSKQSVEVLEQNFQQYKKILEKGYFYIIGKKVTSKLRAMGLVNILGTFENSSSLINYLKKNNFNNYPFVYLCGSIFSNSLIEETKNLGIKLETMFLYETIQRNKFTNKTLELIMNKKINAVALYSSYTAKTFVKLVSDSKLTEATQDLQYFCLSPQIATILLENQFRRVNCCKSPVQEEMIEMLKAYKII